MRAATREFGERNSCGQYPSASASETSTEATAAAPAGILTEESGGVERRKHRGLEVHSKTPVTVAESVENEKETSQKWDPAGRPVAGSGCGDRVLGAPIIEGSSKHTLW